MHPMLQKIDSALALVASDRIRASANPDVHDVVIAEVGITWGNEDDPALPNGSRAFYNGVYLQRSSAQIPGDGYTVMARL